jgi:iron-sulfur cluster insertion protein
MSVIARASVSKATTPKTPITITPAAALKSWKLIQEEGNTDLKLRISILGGGCHGFRYQIDFSDTIESDDTVITVAVQPKKRRSPKVDWVVGAISLQLLSGIEVDYVSDLQGERFIIRNLKVKTTCSCGHSFAVPDAEKEEAAS